ncbi:MAG: hypothetical protein JXA73_08715 [Acidobacteria bacterium]|nr:hypothetical protein [Acidobacteriota bacterium]
MERGYIKLWRKIQDCKALQERGKVLSKFEAWIDIVMVRARGKDDGGLKRGEFEASYRFLARAWRWDVHKVFRFMSQLEAEGMLFRNPISVQHPAQHQRQHLAQHFIVCNYDTYNPINNGNDNTFDNTQRNKVKECINKRKIKETSQAAGAAAMDPLPSTESLQLSERLRQAIQVRDPKARACRLPDLTHWARDIEKIIRIDGRRVEDVEAVIAWCQNDSFWGPNILSGRKLRDKFDTMWGQMRRKCIPDLVGETDIPDNGERDPAYAELVRQRARALDL